MNDLAHFSRAIRKYRRMPISVHLHPAWFPALCTEVEAHPEQLGLRHALEELQFFSHEVRILGVYPAHPFRKENNLPAE